MRYEVVVHQGVQGDFGVLVAEQSSVPEDWRLSADEGAAAIDQAVLLMRSLGDNPHQGEIMQGRANATILRGCRRMKFDPAEPWPRSSRGRPRPRMRIVWINEPDDGTVERVRVLSVTHRFDSRPYNRAASRLGEVRRQRMPKP